MTPDPERRERVEQLVNDLLGHLDPDGLNWREALRVGTDAVLTFAAQEAQRATEAERDRLKAMLCQRCLNTVKTGCWCGEEEFHRKYPGIVH